MLPTMLEWAAENGLELKKQLTISPGGKSKSATSSWVFYDENATSETPGEEALAGIVLESSTPSLAAAAAVVDPCSTPDCGAAKKKKKKKKAKKKEEEGSRIKWGAVEEILFCRAVASSAVPNSGGYPLGLGIKNFISSTDKQ